MSIKLTSSFKLVNMIQTEFSAALNQICSERGLSKEVVVETIKVSLLSAYRKDCGGRIDDIEVNLDQETGEVTLLRGGKDITPSGFGRIAAQTAKQVILQRIREAEKQTILDEYKKKVGSIVTGHVFRVERGKVVLDLGKTQGVMPLSEQMPRENYQINSRFKVLVKEVKEESRGPEVILSRSDPQFIKELFALEVPEIDAGVVKIEGMAREAGLRTKVAVSASRENIDPVGSCVGQKGVRVQAVMAEIGEERIDIVPYSKDTETYIANALSPAKVKSITINKKKKEAKVQVSADQLSLSIGKEGQNVRLAAKLTGWKIDIRGEKAEKVEEKKEEMGVTGLEEVGLSKRVVSGLIAAGITDLKGLRKVSEENLKKIKGLGPKALKEIKEALKAE